MSSSPILGMFVVICIADSAAEEVSAKEGAVAHKATVLDRHWFALVEKEDKLRRSKEMVEALQRRCFMEEKGQENSANGRQAGWLAMLGRWVIRMVA